MDRARRSASQLAGNDVAALCGAARRHRGEPRAECARAMQGDRAMNDIVAVPLAMKRPVVESTFRTHDDVELFYRHWPATQQPVRGALVLFHRGHEHSGRLDHLPDELDLPQFDCFAWDARGHGRSPGPRGFSPSLGTSVRDVQTFIDHIALRHRFAVEEIAVVAQSVGAVLVATWAHDYAPRIRCMVLASPAFKVKLYVPFARAGLALMRTLRGHFFVNSYVNAKFLTHDPERIASYDADPLITRPISVNILLSLYETAERIVDDAQAIVVPTQLLVSGADCVVVVARNVLGGDESEPHRRRGVIRGNRAWPQDRLRFRQHSRLRLSQSRRRRYVARQAHRS